VNVYKLPTSHHRAQLASPPALSPLHAAALPPPLQDVVAFQCRNPVHRAHYELFTRALDAENVREGGVVLVHPTCGPTQDDDIPGTVRYQVSGGLTHHPAFRSAQQHITRWF
jgi:hypothetical protein